MNISFFIGGLSGGGAERITCELANYFAGKGHNVSIVAMGEAAEQTPLDRSIAQVVLLGKKEKKFFIYNNLLRYRRLAGYVKENSDHTYIVMLPVTTILLLMQRRRISGPIIVSERSAPNRYSFAVKLLLRHYLKNADAFVAQLPDVLEYYRGYLRDCIERVFPNPVKVRDIEVCSSENRKKSIIAAGRLVDVKNYDLLIDAFSKISNDFGEYNLEIYGQGELRDHLQNKISSLGLDDRIILAGHTNDVRDEMRTASIFVLCSRFEGMPNSLMEAMAEGTPVIATDCPAGGPRFLIENDKTGILIPVNDADALAKEMAYLLNNPDTAQKMGENAKESMKKHSEEDFFYNWEHLLSEMKG